MKKLLLDFKKIITESPFPAFLLSKDHRILYVNEAFCKLLGKDRAEVEGKYCYEVMHGLKELPEFCPLKEGEVCILTGCGKDEKRCPLCPLEECEEKAYPSKPKSFYFKEFYEPSLKKILSVNLLTLFDEKGKIFGYLHFIEALTENIEFSYLFEKVVETYPGYFFINDEEFNILFMNENLRKLCENEDSKCYVILYGRKEPCPTCPIFTEKAEEEVYSPKLKRYFIRYFRIFKSQRGKIFKITFYADITEQIRLFEETGIPLVVATLEGEILRVNKRARELFGIPEDFDLRNLKAQDFWQNPEDRKFFLERLFKEGKVVDLEIKLKKLDGTPFFALISARLFEENGKNLIYSAIEDITEYLKAKEEAFKFNERVLEFIPVGVAVIDERDRVLYVNTKLSEITGYSKEDLKEANLYQLLIADEKLKERAKKILEEIAKGARSQLAKKRVEFPARKKDGSLFMAEIYFDEFYLEGKRLFIGLIQDITDRKKLEERLLKEEKEFAIEKIAGGLAHDLNNILMIVKGYLELLKEKRKEMGKKKISYLEKIEEAFERMRHLVGELFVLSKGEMKKKEWVNITEFLKTWVPFYLRGSQINITLDLEEGLYLPIQESHLLSLVQNLILNARDAMENVGKLRVRAYTSNGYLFMEFEDSGCGIPEEYLEKIFEPGFSTKPQGSGLGLYVVKRIVELYEGKIEVNSIPREGTNFILKFPLKERQAILEEVKEIPQRKEISEKKILVLDDEAEIREVLKEFLQERGFEVETAENGDEAFELILKAEREDKPFEILILDLTVPEGKGGLYLLRRLLSEGRDLSRYKTILITGFTEKEVIKEAGDLKINHILYKPFNLEKLLEVLS